jgi:hypothetical protein
VKNRRTMYRGLLVMIGLLLANTSHAFDMGNIMNPSKWMGGNNRDDDYYDHRGYGYGGPGWGYPGYGYGGPGWGGYPGYGYGAPGWGGYPGYGYGAPGYGYPGYGGGASQGNSTPREIQ